MPERQGSSEKGEQAMAILNAAERLFFAQGYNGTSMRTIAKEAGYRSVAGLYNHFADKEAIFEGLIRARQPYDDIIAQVQALNGDTPEELISGIFQSLTQLMDAHMDFFRLVMIDYLEFGAIHVRELINDIRDRIYGMVQRITPVANLSEEVPPIVFIRLMGIQVFGYVMTKNIMPESFLGLLSDEQWRSYTLDLILNGMVGIKGVQQ
ncbi:MAG: TetR/AcrR family transcriptional regulator [Chloroflexi bacterium]|nr:TetR/AcrR family transcriptional regulator [Chloroflexota bacterium]